MTSKCKCARNVSIVAVIFCAVVGVMLVKNYKKMRVLEPLSASANEYQKLEELKIAAVESPRDQELKDKVRDIDKTFRAEYFKRKAFANRGARFLGIGALIFLLSTYLFFCWKKLSPVVKPKCDGMKMITQRRARLATVMFGALILVSLPVIYQNSIIYPNRFHLVEKVPTPSGNDIKPAPAVKLATAPTAEETAKNWPRFRGVGGLGHAVGKNYPTTWNGETGENILWKTPIELPGYNSPVVWGDKILLSGADKKTQKVFCYSADGKLAWGGEVNPKRKAEAQEPMEDTGFAPSTMATDGRVACAIFPTGDVGCFDMNGKRLWQKNLGAPDNMYGHASSLLIHKNSLIIQFDQGELDDDKGSVIALDVASGNQVWKAPRKSMQSWSSPIIANLAGRDQLILVALPDVTSYNPNDGKRLWYANCFDSGEMAPSPVISGDTVFVGTSFAGLKAIKADGSGDVSETHIKWEADEGLPDTASFLCDEKFIYLPSNDGMLTCYNIENGKLMWEGEFDEGFQSSPTLVGDLIYLMHSDGNMQIVKGGEKFEKVSTASLGEMSPCSPAFVKGKIYIRSNKNLFCIGTK